MSVYTPTEAVPRPDDDAGPLDWLPVKPAAPALPQPPDESERDVYFGPQWRWVNPASLLGYLLIVVSVWFFVERHPWTMALLVPLALSTVGMVLAVVTSSYRRRWTLAEHAERVSGWEPDYIPALDVLLPSAGEPVEVLHNTYRHVAALQWHGRLDVLVLDDAAREEVRQLAEQHGFRYLSRPDRGKNKKAGNLQYGLERSEGDFVLILDADFVPRRDLFYELTPYFDDPAVGIVQSPQYFDIGRSMNWVQRGAAATQIFFYRWVQPSRDRADAAICVGTSALYRREALTRIGGFPLIGHSEDVYTGVEMTKQGFATRYVPTVVTKGLCPDGLEQFITQQYRWCLGSLCLLADRGFHRTKMGLRGRLCFWAGFLYYITTAVNVFALALPPILLAFFAPGEVAAQNYIFVAMAMVGRQAIVPFIAMGKDSLVGLARIEMTYSFCHAIALSDAVRGRMDSWAPTGTKAASPTATRVKRLIRFWCVGVQVLLWAGIIWRLPDYGIGAYWCMIAFALFNLWMVSPMVWGRTTTPPRRAHALRREPAEVAEVAEAAA